MHKLRSSFFYFLFPVVGGTFAAVALSFYYSRLLHTRSMAFSFVALFVGLCVQASIYVALAQTLPAPFYLRDFLNQTQGATASSLLGLSIAFVHLIVLRRYNHVDPMAHIEKEWPTIPSLLCCACGGIVNICLVAMIFWYFN